MSFTDWSTVRAEVTGLRRLPGAVGVLGARRHRFRLEPPLTPAALAEVQRQLGVALPEDYAAFLTQVGAGGAGPYQGVFPLRRINGRWQWDGDGANLTDAATLGYAFPARGPEAAEISALVARYPVEGTFADGAEYKRAVEAWHQWVEALLWRPQRTAGAICICHVGSARRVWLVVSGPERGNMWSDCRVDHEDLEPITRVDRDRVDFASWYLDWLDRARRQAHDGRGRR